VRGKKNDDRCDVFEKLGSLERIDRRQAIGGKMRTQIAFVLLSVWTCSAQIVLPEGTKVRVKLDQHISSATAVEGQIVELSVTDAILVGESVVIPEGARVTGTITQAQEKRRLGRAGKLDFSIDRVKTADNQWISLRYTVTKKSGQSHAVSTGILTAGVAAVFWPAAPVFLLRKGADITINRGTAFDVFTDANHTMNTAAPAMLPTNSAAVTLPVAAPAARIASAAENAALSVTSPVASAEIEVDGVFVGNTPTILHLPPGPHRIIVKSGIKAWERTVQVTAGSTVSLNAALR
jgi:hypothetical protein